jgi:hypothetical protein
VSCQQQAGVCNLAADPILTYAFTQTGAAARPTPIQALTNGSDRQYLRFTVTVPAGQTVSAMEFEQLSDTPAHAITDAALFNTNGALQGTDYLTGLSPAQQSQIVNWTLNPTPVPTLSQWALASMAALLGLLGFATAGLFGRRRQRSS